MVRNSIENMQFWWFDIKRLCLKVKLEEVLNLVSVISEVFDPYLKNHLSQKVTGAFRKTRALCIESAEQVRKINEKFLTCQVLTCQGWLWCQHCWLQCQGSWHVNTWHLAVQNVHKKSIFAFFHSLDLDVKAVDI